MDLDYFYYCTRFTGITFSFTIYYGFGFIFYYWTRFMDILLRYITALDLFAIGMRYICMKYVHHPLLLYICYLTSFFSTCETQQDQILIQQQQIAKMLEANNVLQDQGNWLIPQPIVGCYINISILKQNKPI